ncbi:hypothetical protein [Streptomyces vinaceus]|uniref:hypothetical protein n=1 Tax=Streptomyces vinaceus TaxID=1960 RepID=UPI0036BB3065
MTLMVFWMRAAPCATTVINELTSGSARTGSFRVDQRELDHRSKGSAARANSFSGSFPGFFSGFFLRLRRPRLSGGGGRCVSDSFKTAGPVRS